MSPCGSWMTNPRLMFGSFWWSIMVTSLSRDNSFQLTKNVQDKQPFYSCEPNQRVVGVLSGKTIASQRQGFLQCSSQGTVFHSGAMEKTSQAYIFLNTPVGFFYFQLSDNTNVAQGWLEGMVSSTGKHVEGWAVDGFGILTKTVHKWACCFPFPLRERSPDLFGQKSTQHSQHHFRPYNNSWFLFQRKTKHSENKSIMDINKTLNWDFFLFILLKK